MVRVLLHSVVLVLLTLVASAVTTENSKHTSNEFLEPFGREVKLPPKTRLRVCNAYPYQTPLDVSLGDKLLTDKPMPYKACREFDTHLERHNKIHFKFGDASAGAFVVSDLPNNDAVLLLVVYRHDAASTAVAFESHVFSNLLNSQIAVIDTYRGAGQATLRIQDTEDAVTDRSEVMQYDNVAAVNAGSYEVALVSADGALLGRENLVAENRESYAVIRCGVEPKEGKSYPDEIMIFPMPEQLKSSGSRSHVLNAITLGLFIFGFAAN